MSETAIEPSPTAARSDGGRLAGLRVRGPEGESDLDADACFVFIGAAPRTAPTIT